MTTRMDVQQIADRLALQDVMARYAAGVDERDFALYAAQFAPDVEIIGFSTEPIVGLDAWMDYVRSALEKYAATQHMLGPVLAQVNGERAECRTDVQALHYLRDDPDQMVVLWATYLTQMRRTSDGWRIIQHELVRRGTRRF